MPLHCINFCKVCKGGKEGFSIILIIDSILRAFYKMTGINEKTENCSCRITEKISIIPAAC
jgi:hypothetical protein